MTFSDKRLVELTSDIKGFWFRSPRCGKFKVVSGQFVPYRDLPDPEQRKYLRSIGEAHVLSIQGEERAEPVVTVSGGVYRLRAVERGPHTYFGAAQINDELQVKQPHQPVPIVFG